MSLQEEFENAASRAQKLNEKPSNENLLKLYALYKQGTEGDNSHERPGGFDFKAAAKYDAWEKLKGKDKEEAKKEYIVLVDELSK